MLAPRSATARLGLAAFAALLATPATAALAQSWNFRGIIADGEQIDAVAQGGKVHLVSSKYYQFDKDENILVAEAAGDPSQTLLWAFMFPPALAVAPDGTVHIAVREQAGSSYENGWLNIRHRRRDPAGSWNSGYLYSSPTKWNWNVGVADDGAGHVYMMSSDHGGGDSVWADLTFFMDSGAAASGAGAMSSVYRVDYEARLRGEGGKIYFASGNSFTSSSAYFSHASGGATDLASQFNANLHSLNAGTGSEKGFPDMAIDGLGNVHYTYGSGHTDHSNFPASTAGCVPGEVHYNKFDADGNKLFSSDRTLFTALGAWHLSVGLSAVGASDDGNTVVAVALRSPDHKEAGDSDLLWSVSQDGGASWSAPADLGVNTFGGEGRQRPRLVALGSKFFLFYKANGTLGTSLATIEFPESPPPAPSQLTATAVSSSQIDACWQDNAANEEGFSVERDAGDGFEEIAATGADTSCYTDHSVDAGTTYTYRVRAFSGAVNSAYSNEAAATPPAPPPGEADAGVGDDGGFEDSDALVNPSDDYDLIGGCSCQSQRSTAGQGLLLALSLALVGLGRRRRRAAPGSHTRQRGKRGTSS